MRRELDREAKRTRNERATNRLLRLFCRRFRPDKERSIHRKHGVIVIHTAIRIRTVLLSYCLIFGEFIGNRVSSEHGHLTTEKNASMRPRFRTVSSDSGLGCRLTGEPSAVRAPHPHYTPIHRKPGVSLSYPIHVLFVKSHRKHGVFPRCIVPPVTAVIGVKSRATFHRKRGVCSSTFDTRVYLM